MRRFKLLRHVDHSGVSGTGLVAEGVVFGDGKAVVHWRGPYASIVVWDNIEHAIEVHGHGGGTELVWLDLPEQTEAERSLRLIEGWEGGP